MHVPKYILVSVITVLAVLVTVGSLGVYWLYTKNSVVEDELAYARVQINDLAEVVQEKEEQIEVHKELLRILQQQAKNNIYDLSYMRSLVESASATVEDIRKLEEADQELLAKYSKVFFLNEHYTPAQLSYIPSEFVYSGNQQQIAADVAPFLLKMLNAMEGAGLSPRVISAYRSFGYQSKLKHNHEVTYGTTVANQFVADQGYSEHQLGTTVDFVNTEIGSNMEAFDKTAEYTWLLNHAHKYGFTLSYPPNNAYYAFEPWHWRFVGIALATDLHTRGMHFYDMPQRDINAYRLHMFDTE